jgi:dUTP pyrophosphatase
MEDFVPPCPVLKIKKLDQTAIVPTRGSKEAAGLDLYSLECAEIPHNSIVQVRTGISIVIPRGYYGAVCSRSGNVIKLGLAVANQPGIIDSDYRGEIKVLLTSLFMGHLEVAPGQRIAQLIIQPYSNRYPMEVDNLDDTDRGIGGFGSTGQ